MNAFSQAWGIKHPIIHIFLSDHGLLECFWQIPLGKINWEWTSGTRRCSFISLLCVTSPVDSVPVWSRWCTAISFGQHTQQPATKARHRSRSVLPVFWGRFVFLVTCSGLSLNTVACQCAPRYDPVVTAFNSHQQTQQNTRRQ